MKGSIVANFSLGLTNTMTGFSKYIWPQNEESSMGLGEYKDGELITVPRRLQFAVIITCAHLSPGLEMWNGSDKSPRADQTLHQLQSKELLTRSCEYSRHKSVRFTARYLGTGIQSHLPCIAF